MYEVRIHGRGGQGVVTAAELLSVAGFLDGLEAQAFPSFGSERMGAPVVSYCRLDHEPIRVREPVFTPDAVVVVDSTLLHHVDVFEGLRPDAVVVLNSARTIRELGLDELKVRLGSAHVVTVDATRLARERIGRPLPNVCLLGAFCALTGQVAFPSLEAAVRRRFDADVAERNVAAARAAYDQVSVGAHA